MSQPTNSPRKRTKLSDFQKERLEDVYSTKIIITKDVVNEISKKINLNTHSIRIWFNNRKSRAKVNSNNSNNHDSKNQKVISIEDKGLLQRSNINTPNLTTEKRVSVLKERSDLDRIRSKCTEDSNKIDRIFIEDRNDIKNGTIRNYNIRRNEPKHRHIFVDNEFINENEEIHKGFNLDITFTEAGKLINDPDEICIHEEVNSRSEPIEVNLKKILRSVFDTFDKRKYLKTRLENLQNTKTHIKNEMITKNNKSLKNRLEGYMYDYCIIDKKMEGRLDNKSRGKTGLRKTFIEEINNQMNKVCF
eukprot:GHVP01043983.1.p1 GENE.GHVP01043983.1~~GHVP01043983.1.p1  ORF type:complete len:304 (-),score=30.71 GHVP01043983.1:587-1498(-)